MRGYIYDKREHFNKTGYIKSKCNHSLTTSSDSLCLLLLHRYAIGEDPSQMYGPAPYNLWWVAQKREGVLQRGCIEKGVYERERMNV